MSFQLFKTLEFNGKLLTCYRRGMATLVGKDVSKLKTKGRGKWKYMSEKEMLEISSRFAPYRYVTTDEILSYLELIIVGVFSCGICGE